MSQLKKTLVTHSRRAGGAFKTVHDRMVIVSRFAEAMKQHNIQIKEMAHIKTRHIELYIHERLEQGIGKRTLQNEMAAVRQTLREYGREKLAASPQLSNKALGIGNASRAGAKVPIPDELYQRVLQAASQKDEGLAITLRLSRELGLRSEEAVQSAQSLKTWNRELKDGKDRLTVIYGTKGGRPRQTLVLDRESLQQTISDALRIAEQCNGKLIDRPELKQAMTYWRNHTRRMGMTGKHSPHSLRYAWSQDAIRHYREQGYSEKEAQALTSMDLGHGDGRGRYVAYVYGLKDVET